MKICICGSLTFTDEVMALAREIEANGEHELLLPNSMVAGLIKDPGFDPVQSKIDTNAVNNHIDKVRKCDVVLVCNYEKKGFLGTLGRILLSRLRRRIISGSRFLRSIRYRISLTLMMRFSLSTLQLLTAT